MMEKLVREWSNRFGLKVRENYDANVSWEEKLYAARLIDEEYKELTYKSLIIMLNLISKLNIRKRYEKTNIEIPC